MKISEIRRFLLRFAKKEGLRLHEHLADGHYFCHIEGLQKGLPRTSTATSQESADNALIMAFFSWENPKYNFLD